MKTSKIILTSFLSVVGLFLLSLLITVEGNKNHKELQSTEESFGEVKVIIVKKGANVTLSNADTNKVKFEYQKDSTYKMPYAIIGDTLVLKAHKQNQQNWHYKVSLNQSVNTIINNGGSVTCNLVQDSISITNKNKGKLYINRDSPLKDVQIISAEQSSTTISTSAIQNLNLKVDNATIMINKSIQNIHLVAKNNAKITLHKTKNLAVQCDESSRYRVY